MNIWHDIDAERISSNNFMAVVEIPKGCKAKYELDKKTGLLKLDRVFHTSTHTHNKKPPCYKIQFCVH